MAGQRDRREFGIERMSEAEFELFMEEPRTCSKCNWTGKIGDFPMTKARGRLTIRKWCPECLRKYYRERRHQLTTGEKP